MIYKWQLTSIITIAIFVFGCAEKRSDTIVIEDFNGDSYGDWIAEGTAFATGPAGGEDSHRMLGLLGSGFAASVNYGNEPAIGTLTSPPFLIERKSIHFLISSHELHFLPGPDGMKNPEDQVIQLLVDKKVVRSQVPDEFHAMFWRSWDVSEFKGKKAQIRIVDNDNRKWAHIDIDHIIQNDIPVEGFVVERQLSIDKTLLNMPVKKGILRNYLELFVDGKQIRGIDVGLATGDVDYWVVADLTPWMGKEVTVRTRKYDEEDSSILDRLAMADDILESGNLYQESLRSQFHFSSKRGWINDPNGLVYYDGEWHLFYQHNPYNWDHSRNDYNKTWGHAVSTDLVYWNELPGAIHPDHLGPIYSGSAVVDFNNTTGFQTGDEKPIVCIYTSAGGRSPWSIKEKFSQSLAYSNDRGRTFTIYEGNPVQPNIEYINRDPKAIWHEETNQWVVILHFDERAMGFFTSKDLKTWQFNGEIESEVMSDCPELFQLALDGNENNKKWILHGGSAHYLIGDFDGKMFKPQSDYIKYNYGNGFYASQTFNDVPKEDGRRIQMAWGLTPTEGMPFNMIMLFPVELTLQNTEEGPRMYAYPVKEIENIHGKEHAWTDIQIFPKKNILANLKGELFDIDVEFYAGNGKEFGFVINGYTVAYDKISKQLSCGENKVKLLPINGIIQLRILVDRVSTEIYANHGRIYMPMRTLPTGAAKGLEVYSIGGNTKLRSLKVREVKSIWDY
jgi:sucrose-6-phosphate hydrolase SacC (GH32 family)